MSAGYVYVLVNSSMPGLVKVGRTSREPALRVQELSGATGVATPFVIAFSQYFLDAGEAETFVHFDLERRGVRASSNREFFRATASDVVRVVLNAPGACDPPAAEVIGDAQELDDSDLLPNQGYNSDGLALTPTNAWDDLLREADCYRYGLGDTLQDDGEALSLYIQAARLGSIVAYKEIGEIYFRLGDIGNNYEKSLQFLKEGSRRGNYYCDYAMARLFDRVGHFENAAKCYRKFFSRHRASEDPQLEDRENFAQCCAFYIMYTLDAGYEVEFREDLRPLANDIITILEENRSNPKFSDSFRAANFRANEWVSNNLITPLALPLQKPLALTGPLQVPPQAVRPRRWWQPK